MEEYKNWLESKIDETDESLGYSLDEKRYGGAFWYSTKRDVYKECLKEFERLQDKSDNNNVSFNGLKVGKKYIRVSEDGTSSNAFIVLRKGHDNIGDYITYYIIATNSISCRTYEEDFTAVKYFKEVQ